jgi:hypothetical protein
LQPEAQVADTEPVVESTQQSEPALKNKRRYTKPRAQKSTKTAKPVKTAKVEE